MRALTTLGAVAITLATALTTGAAEIAWLTSLDKGLKEARQSGRAILYVTLWKPGT
jgi:hypothetical protein